jgi:hypothetical protein
MLKQYPFPMILAKLFTAIVLVFPLISFPQHGLDTTGVRWFLTDTIKVYNVHCSYSQGNSFSSWGGNYTAFYPSEKCPEGDKQKYISNRAIVEDYWAKKQFFWMKLYNTSDQLIYEGLNYSDCTVGPFICYWPNGKTKLKGQYNGYSFSAKKGYKIKKCPGKETGTWEYYNETGKFLRNEKH